MTTTELCGMQIVLIPGLSSHMVSAEQQKFAPFLTTNILQFYQW